MVEKSRVKFTKTKTGEIVGFVSRLSTNELKGVHEGDGTRKSVCVLSKDLKGSIEPDALYDVELRPMHGKNGYVVTSATRTFFEAQIESVIKPHKVYKVVISFGYKKIYFDPLGGKTPSSCTLHGVLEVLNARKDLQNADGVISDFIDRAQELMRRMKEDGYDVG